MNGSSIAANSTEKFTIPSSDVPTAATAVAANVTVVPETMNPGFLTIYPTSDSSAPVASDINWTDGMVVPNFTYLPTDGTGSFNAFNNPGGAVNLVADVFGYFTPVTVSNAVQVVADPSSIPAETEQTSMLTASVLHNGAPVTNDTLSASVSPSSCGSVSSFTAVSNVSGAYTATFTSNTTSTGTCTVSVTDAEYGQTGSATITLTTPKNGIATTLTDGPLSPITPSGPLSSYYDIPEAGNPVTIGVTVTSPSNSDVSNDAVTASVSSSPSGVCAANSSLNSTSETTSSSGAATFTYFPSDTVGFCTVTLTEAATGGTSSFTFVQESSTPNEVTAASLTASPTSVLANGSATSSLTATLTYSSTSVTSDPVMILTPANTAACGTVSPVSQTIGAATNTNGSLEATGSATYTSSSVPGDCELTVIEANSGLSNTVTVSQQLQTYSVSVTSSASSVPVSSSSSTTTSTLTITATVTNNTGAAVSDDPVTFSVAASSSGGPSSGTAGCGSFAPTSAYANGVHTNGLGQATVTYTPGTGVGFCTITATELDTNASGTVTISQS
jgi:hypothetical protein